MMAVSAKHHHNAQKHYYTNRDDDNDTYMRELIVEGTNLPLLISAPTAVIPG